MKRTTIYLDPELESRLKRETRRQKRPMAELIREALRQCVGDEPARQPPGAGAFASGRRETAADTMTALSKSGLASPGRPWRCSSTRASSVRTTIAATSGTRGPAP